MSTIVWFRDDLRIADNPALLAAATKPGGLIALYILDEDSPEIRPLGSASKWWLHESLDQLSKALAELKVPLIFRRGPARSVLPAVIDECNADRIYWNRRYGNSRQIDMNLKEELISRDIEVHSFPGNLLFEPGKIMNKNGGPYRVYSAFWRACLESPNPALPLPIPESLTAASKQPNSENIEDWALQPTSPNWAQGLNEKWRPGENHALLQLKAFLRVLPEQYSVSRDYPAISATSELSPYLRWGEISVRTIWHSVMTSKSINTTFLSEIGWREFAWHTLFFHPDMSEKSINPKYDHFPWQLITSAELAAWQQGETGFPLIDAGMKELWHTGFMHNRVRMVTASFLSKNLLCDWRLGESWFWDTLVDADEASNPFNWQWVAGCGLDAAPYFRIFNPQTQQKKFDPDGKYVAKWAEDSLLTTPMVDLAESRMRALAANNSIRSESN